MIKPDSARGRLALFVAHCAGLVDMVALPLWVGTLIQQYRFDPQQAGLIVTLFLAGAVVASVLIAPLFSRLATGRWIAAASFALAALAFHLLAGTSSFGGMAALHAVGGAAIGAALSVTHGTVARSDNPHRLFALCGGVLGVFALLFLATMPQVMARVGGHILFEVYAAVMLLAALMALATFPAPNPVPAAAQLSGAGGARAGSGVWGGIIGLCCMSLIQAMSFSFFERVGADRGFSVDQITAVLVALGFVNMFPTVLAAVLEKHVPPRHVLIGGPIVQAVLAISIFASSTFAPYAAASSVFVAVILFTHVFGFGLLARLDVTGRVLAATPAMMMTGAAIGPVLGGTLVKFGGYPALGIAATVLAIVAVIAFSRLPNVRPAQAVLQTA